MCAAGQMRAIPIIAGGYACIVHFESGFFDFQELPAKLATWW
jgi:hypothetical protein